MNNTTATILLLFSVIIGLLFTIAINNIDRPYDMDQKLLNGEITEDEYCDYFANSLRPPLVCYKKENTP